MRAARTLQMLMLLQNRGRMTCAALASALEVSTRTVLRDVDALTEAGLPVIVHRGAQGGIELGFDYRTRLAAFDAEEAEAIGLILNHIPMHVAALGLGPAAARAQAKLREAFADRLRERMDTARKRFAAEKDTPVEDARVLAVARAIRSGASVRVNAFTDAEITICPVALRHTGSGWLLESADGAKFPESGWGHINISRAQPSG